ncbi:hypothetical protein PACTADRAFT_44539 [Pachysolen tannophilus NRRL Y-2460]|uniref:Protein-lysine N-methyltransferase EFM4 n=1 Tax=Pachysolen tannophilus NRRL Y-2460 TaxID=669874 RepID=A0A1E4TR88_PACTA|nr:hypothetical protein PACTADRAFT_44539 [Pachysolen tannophilus NRRL Y-2460]
MSEDDTTRLNPSKLGTKKYWEDFYALEKSNFEENPEDTGECWFSDSDAELKMVDFLFDNMDSLGKQNGDIKICDLGTGNGHLIFTLREEGFKGKLVGLDYSENSVAFCKEILKEQHDGDDKMVFEKCDILNDDEAIFEMGKDEDKFDVVLDKGTLDAIALSDSRYKDDKLGVELYPSNVKRLLRKDGILLISSCNFTENELVKIIESEQEFKKWKCVEYPSFEFGGVKGQTICTIAFKKTIV